MMNKCKSPAVLFLVICLILSLSACGGIRNFGSRSAAGLLKRGELGLLCAGRGQRCRSLPILPEGSYHLYDYQFFFRNLQQNVEQRINSYMEDILDKAE